MADLWARVPVPLQDLLATAALLLPALLAGALALRGFAPGPLARAILWRFRAAAAVFAGLVAVAVGLGVGLTAQERALRAGSARAAEPFDLVLGAPGSELTLTLAAVYLQPADMPLLSGAQVAEVLADPDVAFAAPIAFGDSHEGAPVVGTTAAFVEHLAGAPAEGRAFAATFEAVAGAAAPVAVGERFSPAHGVGEAVEGHAGVGHDGEEGDGGHAHDGYEYEVVGRMAPTGSPWDRAILVPVEGVWEVHGLPNGQPDEARGRVGPPWIPALFPGTPALLVRPDGVAAAYALRSRYGRADMMAVFPGTVLAQLHGVLREVREAMSVLALATQGLVAVAALAGLFLLTRLFARHLALLRAVGAPRRFVLAVVWSVSAALVGAGAAGGLLLGWLAAAALSALVTARTGVLVEARLGWGEAQAVAAFASLAVLLALLPALLASRRPLLDDLRA